MTWREFKELVEGNGVTDYHKVDRIDYDDDSPKEVKVFVGSESFHVES